MFWRKRKEQPEPKKIEPELKRRRKHFTKEEYEKIREMLEKDMRVCEIAKELGRTERSIYNFIHKQKLRTSLKESLPKLVKAEANLKKSVEDLDQAIVERESRLKALDEQIKTKENEVKALQERCQALKNALDYYNAHKEELWKELQRYADVITIQRILGWLDRLMSRSP